MTKFSFRFMVSAVVFDTIAAVVASFTKHDDVAMILCCMTLSLIAVNARFDDIESQRIAQADREPETEPEFYESETTRDEAR
jgi:hypothetical protein